MMKYFLTLAIIATTYYAHAQQAWTQKKGEAYVQLGASTIAYNSLFAAEMGEDTTPLPREVSETIIGLYAEYGILDKLTVSTFVPFHLASTGAQNDEWKAPVLLPEGDFSGLGNIHLGLTYNILKKNNGLVFSGKLNTLLPTADYDAATGLQTGYDAFGVSPTLLVGLGKSNYFASAEAGATIMNNDYSSRFIVNAQIGKQFLKSKKLTGIFSIHINAPMDEKTDIENLTLNGTAVNTGLYLNEQAYYAFTFKAGYAFAQDWNLWLSAGMGAGQNVAAAPALTFSVGHQFN